MLYIEPAAGDAPVVQVVEQARASVDLNVYELSDRGLELALVAAGHRGVRVRVILEPKPLGGERDSAAAHTWCMENAPYVVCQDQHGFDYDHAKYVVADGHEALVGTANFTYAAFTHNREYLVATADPAVAQALENVFNADWQGVSAGEGPRHALVLSPGALPAFQALFQQPGTLDIEAEEFGSVRELETELSQKGALVRIIVPSSIGSRDRESLTRLARSGVQVRYIDAPYMHAKLVLTPVLAFVGSENLTTKSLGYNREVGVVLADARDLATLRGQFEADWQVAHP